MTDVFGWNIFNSQGCELMWFNNAIRYDDDTTYDSSQTYVQTVDPFWTKHLRIPPWNKHSIRTVLPSTTKLLANVFLQNDVLKTMEFENNKTQLESNWDWIFKNHQTWTRKIENNFACWCHQVLAEEGGVPLLRGVCSQGNRSGGRERHFHSADPPPAGRSHTYLVRWLRKPGRLQSPGDQRCGWWEAHPFPQQGIGRRRENEQDLCAALRWHLFLGVSAWTKGIRENRWCPQRGTQPSQKVHD